VCALLMLVLLAMQFLPYWTYGEEGTLQASIGQYVWFPGEYKELDTHLGEQLGKGYDITQMVTGPILVLVLSAVGAVLCLVKAGARATALLPMGCGAAGIVTYACTAALRLGSLWWVHLLLAAAILVCGAVTMHGGAQKKN